MKLTQSQKSLVFTLIATGVRPSKIVKKINNELKPSNPLVKEQVSYYIKVFKGLSPEEQATHLPYTMQESFARQEVRINSDIQQVQSTLERLEEKNLTTEEYVQLSRLFISQCNRIGQELGQVRAMSKAGVGNLNLMQTYINKYQLLIKGGEGLTQTDALDVFERLDEVKEDKDEPKTGKPG